MIEPVWFIGRVWHLVPEHGRAWSRGDRYPLTVDADSHPASNELLLAAILATAIHSGYQIDAQA